MYYQEEDLTLGGIYRSLASKSCRIRGFLSKVTRESNRSSSIASPRIRARSLSVHEAILNAEDNSGGNSKNKNIEVCSSTKKSNISLHGLSRSKQKEESANKALSRKSSSKDIDIRVPLFNTHNKDFENSHFKRHSCHTPKKQTMQNTAAKSNKSKSKAKLTDLPQKKQEQSVYQKILDGITFTKNEDSGQKSPILYLKSRECSAEELNEHNELFRITSGSLAASTELRNQYTYAVLNGEQVLILPSPRGRSSDNDKENSIYAYSNFNRTSNLPKELQKTYLYRTKQEKTYCGQFDKKRSMLRQKSFREPMIEAVVKGDTVQRTVYNGPSKFPSAKSLRS